LSHSVREENADLTLIKMRLHTGRICQIRVFLPRVSPAGRQPVRRRQRLSRGVSAASPV